MENFKNKTIGVLGLGKSGQAAALFLARQGAKVLASDNKPFSELGGIIDLLRKNNIEVECEGHSWEFFSKCEYLVVSPGIPLNIPFILEASQKNIPVVSEIELAYHVSPAPIVAVTGTNGKSTTVSLIGHLLNSLGKKVVVAGNIGTSLLDIINSVTSDHVVVMEVSSFQLESIDQFRPKVAVFLNFAPDHLNRHKNMQAYLAAKLRLFKNQSSDDISVLNHDDPVVRKCAAQIRSRIFWFSRSMIVTPGCHMANDSIIVNGDYGIRPVGKRSLFPCPGSHNTENLLAAITAVMGLNLPVENLSEHFATFRALDHRLEFVDNICGISYYDDSKGTNPDATVRAIQSFNTPIVLIAGGSEKGLDLKPISEIGRGRVKALVAIGETGPKFISLFDYLSEKNRFLCDSLEEAVQKAHSCAETGDIVLLSPACASFDMFKNAEDRGEQFHQLIKNLKGAKALS